MSSSVYPWLHRVGGVDVSVIYVIVDEVGK